MGFAAVVRFATGVVFSAKVGFPAGVGFATEVGFATGVLLVRFATGMDLMHGHSHLQQQWALRVGLAAGVGFVTGSGFAAGMGFSAVVVSAMEVGKRLTKTREQSNPWALSRACQAGDPCSV